MYSHLGSSTSRTRRHSIHSKETQEKTPSQTRGSGWTSWVFMTRDLGDRMGPARPLQVTCTVEVPRWLASSLRHSPPLRASTLDHRTQPSRLGAQREGTRSSNTTEQQQSPDQKSSTSAQKTTTNQRHEAPPKTHTHEKTTTRRKAPRRSTKPPKDHEDVLREASRKGAFLSSQRLIPRTDQWRTICLALPPHQARRKIGGKNPRTIGGFFSRPFHSRF